MLAFARENETPLTHNISTRIFTTRDHVWPIKTLDPDYVAPKQFFVLMILLVLVFTSNFVFTWVIPTACACACA